jgi:hypothetical protein
MDTEVHQRNFGVQRRKTTLPPELCTPSEPLGFAVEGNRGLRSNRCCRATRKPACWVGALVFLHLSHVRRRLSEPLHRGRHLAVLGGHEPNGTSRHRANEPWLQQLDVRPSNVRTYTRRFAASGLQPDHCGRRKRSRSTSNPHRQRHTFGRDSSRPDGDPHPAPNSDGRAHRARTDNPRDARSHLARTRTTTGA